MDYIKQAEDFAAKHGVSLAVLGVEFKSMDWDDDNQKRNVFRLRLSRNGESYEFDYGSSIVDSCAMEPKLNVMKESDKHTVYTGFRTKTVNVGINIEVTKTQLLTSDEDIINKAVQDLIDQNKSQLDAFNKKKPRHLKYEDTISEERAQALIRNAFKREIKALETELVYSRDLKSDQEPAVNIYDVLSVMTKYCPDTFEEFCDEFGYNQDRRKAERTFLGVKEEAEAMERLFGDVMEELQEIN